MFALVSRRELEDLRDTVGRLEERVQQSTAVASALVDVVGALVSETRLRNAQYDNLAAKLDLVVVLIGRIADEAERRGSQKPQVILPMADGQM